MRPRAASSIRSPGDTRRRLPRGIAIVFEDNDVLVIDKPTGIITADPAVGDEGRHAAARAGNTVFDILKAYIRGNSSATRSGRPSPKAKPTRRATAPPGPRREGRERDQGVWIIHRLDKEASGLLVFAKSEKAFTWLKEDLRAKRVEREYLALAEGQVGAPDEEGIIQTLIKDDAPIHRQRQRRPDANREPDAPKLAVTHFKVLAVASGRSLVRVRLDTGRKNQIRIHFAERGQPLVGDHRFGAKTNTITRLGLHAAKLAFNHPATGARLEFASPAPASFYRAVGLPAPVEAEPAPLPAAPPAATPAPTTPKAATPLPNPTPTSTRVQTSWNDVAEWYDELLEDRGNDHYDQVILPGTLRLLEPRAGLRLLDVASGQGMLGRRLAALGVESLGIEASPKLVQAAERRSQDEGGGRGGAGATARLARYQVGDARELAALKLSGFDAATCIMALSNIDPLAPVMSGVAAALKPGGRFVCVITHPAFRAVGQTSWEWDAARQRQYRRVDGYLSPGGKPIQMNPGKAARGDSTLTTMTFHRPIQTYIEAMARAGLLVDRLEEWPSLRASTSGPRAAEENRSRREIPLFLGIRAVKVG